MAAHPCPRERRDGRVLQFGSWKNWASFRRLGLPGCGVNIAIAVSAMVALAFSTWQRAVGCTRRLAFCLGIAAAVLGSAPMVAADESMAPRPARVHRGACEALAPGPAYPLANLTLGPETPSSNTRHAVEPIPTAFSVTTLDVPLADLLGESYVVNIHESAAETAEYIACGTIAGEPGPNGLASRSRRTAPMATSAASPGCVRRASGRSWPSS